MLIVSIRSTNASQKSFLLENVFHKSTVDNQITNIPFKTKDILRPTKEMFFKNV